MLKMKYAEKLLRGEKTATIRLGKYIPKYKEVIIHSGGKPICTAKIVKVLYKRVKDLTAEDALMDGFRSLSSLLKELKGIYGSIRPDDIVTIIEFRVLKNLRELSSGKSYMGLTPTEIARLALRYLRGELSSEEAAILKRLAGGLSIRSISRELTGSPLKRAYVRRVIRKTLKRLVTHGLIRVRDGLSRK